MTESLLDFYRKHQISPVRQDIRDLAVHFGRRSALYRHLGILPTFVRDKTVLEIGPGSGFNSLYTASLQPLRYVLVEANPRGVDDIRNLFAGYPDFAARIEIVPLSAEEYRPGTPFDFVLCEGMLALAGVPDPIPLLETVARNTAPGGLLVITCIDAVSDLSEVLRRFVAQWLIDPSEDLSAHVRRLLPVFSPHLSTLRGMSRQHDDWIVDNLLSPASIGPLLSIPDAITALDDGFDVFGSSPRFLTDWRWYKSIGGESDRFNELATESYWSNVHNLLDYRSLSAPREPGENRALYQTCSALRDSVHHFELSRERGMLSWFLTALTTIEDNVRGFAPETADGIADLREALAQPSFDAESIARASHFGPWFGRGQQYLSFSKRSDLGGGLTPDAGHD